LLHRVARPFLLEQLEARLRDLAGHELFARSTSAISRCGSSVRLAISLGVTIIFSTNTGLRRQISAGIRSSSDVPSV
jgi:hypothetical protein